MPRIFEAPPGFVLNPDYLVPELRAQRDALLEALRAIVHAATVHACHHALSVDGQQFYDIARAAIKAVEGENT